MARPHHYWPALCLALLIATGPRADGDADASQGTLSVALRTFAGDDVLTPIPGRLLYRWRVEPLLGEPLVFCEAVWVVAPKALSRWATRGEHSDVPHDVLRKVELYDLEVSAVVLSPHARDRVTLTCDVGAMNDPFLLGVDGRSFEGLDEKAQERFLSFNTKGSPPWAELFKRHPRGVVDRALAEPIVRDRFELASGQASSLALTAWVSQVKADLGVVEAWQLQQEADAAAKKLERRKILLDLEASGASDAARKDWTVSARFKRRGTKISDDDPRLAGDTFWDRPADPRSRADARRDERANQRAAEKLKRAETARQASAASRAARREAVGARSAGVGLPRFKIVSTEPMPGWFSGAYDSPAYSTPKRVDKVYFYKDKLLRQVEEDDDCIIYRLSTGELLARVHRCHRVPLRLIFPNYPGNAPAYDVTEDQQVSTKPLERALRGFNVSFSLYSPKHRILVVLDESYKYSLCYRLVELETGRFVTTWRKREQSDTSTLSDDLLLVGGEIIELPSGVARRGESGKFVGVMGDTYFVFEDGRTIAKSVATGAQRWTRQDRHPPSLVFSVDGTRVGVTALEETFPRRDRWIGWFDIANGAAVKPRPIESANAFRLADLPLAFSRRDGRIFSIKSGEEVLHKPELAGCGFHRAADGRLVCMRGLSTTSFKPGERLVIE